MDNQEAEAARRAIQSGWVTQGPEVAAFEEEFADYVEATHACAVSSCTAALHLALLAAGVQSGDEVITVSHSYISTANSIRYCGAKPVFVDVQPGTFNMDPALVQSAITNYTRAILCVHQMGMPCDLKSILDIANRHKLMVVEDAACAIGSEICWNGTWEKIGKPHAHIACFSFHPRKVITTGDGGMITTSNSEFDRQFRLMRQNGMTVPDAVRHKSKEIIFESYPVLGYNYRMTDIQAAVGRVQLKRIPEILSKRLYLKKRYSELLELTQVTLPEEPSWARSNWQSYCIRLPEDCSQKRVMQDMLNLGVATRRGIMCAHREGAYNIDSDSLLLPESERAQDNSILLPLYPQMSEKDQDGVVRALRSCILKN